MTFIDEAAQGLVGVKASYGDEIRRTSCPASLSSVCAMRTIVANLFSLAEELIGLKYKDDDGDLITMSLDAEVKEAIKQVRGNTLHLFVVVDADKKQPSTVSDLSDSRTALPHPALPEAASPLSVPTSAVADDKEARDAKEAKEAKDAKETKEAKDAKEARDVKQAKELKEAKGIKGTETKALKHRRQELRLKFNRAKQELNDALNAAKEKGDKQAVNQYKLELKDLREHFDRDLAALPMPASEATVPANTASPAKAEPATSSTAPVPLATPTPSATPAAPATPATPVTPAAPATPVTSTTPVPTTEPPAIPAKPVDEAHEVFCRQRQELQDAISDAKKKGDKQSVKEHQSKLNELRNQFIAKRDAQKKAQAEHRAAQAAQKAEQAARKAAVKHQEQALRQVLIAAREAGDKQAIKEAQARLNEFRKIHPKPEASKEAAAEKQTKKEGGAPKQAGNAKNSDFKMELVSNVTVPDGAELPADSHVVKTWRLKNAGSVGWPQGSQPVLLGIRRESDPESPNQSVMPRAEVDVSATLVTPAAPGKYVAQYRMTTPDGVKFGNKLAVSFTVAPAAAQ